MIDMNALRTERRIPENAVEYSVTSEVTKDLATVYLWQQTNGIWVIRKYRGIKPKHCGFYGYRNKENAEKDAKDWIKMYQNMADQNAEYNRKVKAFVRDVVVGDILFGSWGWEQTNCDFYEVTGLVGKKSVKIRHIAESREYTNDMQGTCVPMPGKYIGDEITKVYGYHGVKIHDYLTVSKWDGLPKSWSSYA